MIIPFWPDKWPSGPNSSPTSPARSKTTPAKVTPSQSGHHREATRAQQLPAKSRCGGPPTASIPKTRAQPEEPNSKRSRPSGNNASTGISRAPPPSQQMQGRTGDRQDAPHLVQPTTGNARTRSTNGIRSGRPHPAANHRRAAAQGCGSPDTVMARSHGSRLPKRALSGSRRLASLAAPLRVSSLRCGPLRGVESKTAGARHVGYSRRERTRSLIIGSRSSPCMYLFVSFLVSR
jgi:hypothetical protein